MAPRIDHIGLWTWGGRVFNWKKYLDNMHLSGMDTVVFWHDKVPVRVLEIQEYAHRLNIRILWGFNWSWNSPVCLNSEYDIAEWRDKVLKIIREEYAPINPDGICFQVGGTEFGGKCRLDCAVCRKSATDGVGSLFVKFAGSIVDAVKKEFPNLYLSAGVHLGGVHKSFEDLKVLDPSINIMWEDLPGPGHYIEIPFAYNWDPQETTLTNRTIEMVQNMCQLRGEKEDVAFVIKGFPYRWGGHDPMLLEDFDLAALSHVFDEKWKQAAVYCEQRLAEALTVFRIIAESVARSKTVVMLVEHGLWEYKRYYAAMLINEALHDPFRDPKEVVLATREKMGLIL